MRKLIIAFILINFWISAFPASERRIEWEPVPGAWGYALEIQNSSGEIIVNTDIQYHFYPVSNLDPGEYSFRVATLNILKQKGESTDWVKFTVEKLYVPVVVSVSKKQLVSAHSNKNIILKGKNFRKESRFLLRGNGTEIELKDVEIVSDGEVIINYKPSSSAEGKFDIVVVNRGDAESVLKDAVEVVKPEDAEKYYYIGAGYLANKPMGSWSKYMAPSITGGKLYFQFSLANPAFENILLETEFSGVQYKNLNSAKKSSLTYASLGIGAGYYYLFESLNLELFIKFNAGPAYSTLMLDENIEDKKITSIDGFAVAGAGFRLYIGDSFFIEPAGSWKTVFYKKGFLNEAGASFSAGVRF